MKKVINFLIISIIIAVFAIAIKTNNRELTMNNIQPPKAAIINHLSSNHEETITDNYAWLRDKNWPKVTDTEILKYVTAENDYYTAHENKALEKEIYEELQGRIKEEDESYPIKEDQFYYFQKIIVGIVYTVIDQQHKRNAA